ncbi:type IV pilin protein [Salinisphaera sp. P385]|uniref:Type IV pilin protein n=1 Tax=Spectribacter acetivorans TaxID=3075603 RepID=A0ABU3B4E2_9GAMM|nr:type IV pilin protein [Salinisphaera sp. P385]MDT0617314.1 type IV pilin protein [Salinisphaera sp. P385]
MSDEWSHLPGFPRSQAGFSLLEALILLLLAGAICLALWPHYANWQRAQHREPARQALQELARALEDHHQRTDTYAGAAGTDGEPRDTGAPRLAPTEVVDDGTTYYRLSIVTANRRGFEIRAAPVASQTADTCGTLTLTASGQRGMVGAAPEARRENCWPRAQ